MRIGAKLPNSGPLPMTTGIPALARSLEAAGFDSVWVSDHIVLPATIDSHYPFAPDGKATWATDTPYVDALIALALAAAATERVRIGTAVLVLPLRNPVQFAKQAASIDVASGGRLELGVGAGWLAEEFAALGVPFERRGARMAEWIGVARDLWTGRPAGRTSEFYELPADVVSLPRPAHEIPLLIGGHSAIALKRAGRIGDGWLAQQDGDALDPDDIARCVATIRAASGTDAPPRVVLRIVKSLGHLDHVARALPELEAAGVGEVIVDVGFEDGEPERGYATLKEAAGTAHRDAADSAAEKVVVE
jgi:probable F420-dependent oxidoreductase